MGDCFAEPRNDAFLFSKKVIFKAILKPTKQEDEKGSRESVAFIEFS